jgi:hypothetical protein
VKKADRIRQTNSLIRFFFKDDPALLDDEAWALRAKEAEWIAKMFYAEYIKFH